MKHSIFHSSMRFEFFLYFFAVADQIDTNCRMKMCANMRHCHDRCFHNQHRSIFNPKTVNELAIASFQDLSNLFRTNYDIST